MKLNYIGPLCVGLEHPVVQAVATDGYPPSCYLVEVSDEAGVEGPIIEGDLLVVDEARPVQHADLVVVEIEQEYRLFRSHRIGGSFRLLPASGGRGHLARPQACRGVVVQCQRLSA